ncbi:MAG: Plasmid stabilization system protein [Flavipsychrobacter sp.]|jgi:hypothetical protein|nr:Plasmid stabilization system protein [Flavipsychrobacter sp.]
MPRCHLIFTPEARADVVSAASYYDGQLKGLGKIFRSEIKRQLLLLKQNPFTRSVRYDNVRFAITRKFPYSIHYTIDNDIILYIPCFAIIEIRRSTGRRR